MGLVLSFLFALGKYLLRSPASFPFRASGAAAGCRLPGGLHLRTRGGGAILFSGGLGGGCNRFY
jgi:hypothetical protein